MTRREFYRKHQFAIGLGFALAVVLAIVFVSYRSTRDMLAASRLVAHTHQVISTLEETRAFVETAETSQRAFVITGQQQYFAESKSVRPMIAANLDELSSLVSDSEPQAQRVRQLRLTVEAKLAHVDLSMETYRRDGFVAARQLALAGEGRRAMERVHATIDAMILHEESLLEARRTATDAKARNSLLLLTAGAAADLALLALVLWLVARDARRNRELARALSEARDAAVRSAEMRAQFLANMSHEIRTPMNAVIGMTGLLLDTKLDADQRDLAQTVRTSADALLTIINDILDFSKAEAGKLSIEQSDFELRAALDSIIDLFTESTHAKGIDIGMLVDHELPKVVRGDAGRLRQVLTNLVGNAVKFTAKGDVIVHVTSDSAKGDTVVVRFAVTDTGIGIAEEAIGHLFQPFMQADATTTRRYGGTGLGLAISRHIVENMGGEIGVESVEGKGSTFWFTLPLARGTVDEITQQHKIRSLGGMRVLVVDDNATNRRLVRHNLAAWRMASDEAPGGAEALAMMRDAAADGRPYDLVITDMVMPGMNGVVLARLIKCDKAIAHARVIVLTSMTSRLEVPTMRIVGIDACLTKPVKQSALYDAIANAVGGVAAPVLAPAPALPPATEMRRDVRLLVAEDNAVNQKLAVRQLQRLGLQADTVANGIEAVEAVGRVSYDLVLMDCQMPEMDGFTATGEIRRRESGTRHTPIIALTANALEGDRQRCLAAGMDDYLSKPVDEADLARILAVYLPSPVLPLPRAGADSRAAAGEGSSNVTSAPSLDEAVLDDLRDLSGGTNEFIIELAALFLGDAPPRIEAIGDAIEKKDAEALALAAHGLKSGAGNIGALPLRELTAELEARGNSGRLDGAEATFHALLFEYGRVEEALEALRNG